VGDDAARLPAGLVKNPGEKRPLKRLVRELNPKETGYTAEAAGESCVSSTPQNRDSATSLMHWSSAQRC